MIAVLSDNNPNAFQNPTRSSAFTGPACFGLTLKLLSQKSRSKQCIVPAFGTLPKLAPSLCNVRCSNISWIEREKEKLTHAMFQPFNWWTGCLIEFTLKEYGHDDQEELKEITLLKSAL
ncbi:hypothetical protein CEXT_101961 [Caerostris extrusa]|uniref:Uncharacterized protein n=1 Tax=Caerostris extrusa TaxID=172846 RepID=A0AAV4Y7T9_CAEEX|nr:hypothetical protein CEXT_101961 [Caerostris extrusa]